MSILSLPIIFGNITSGIINEIFIRMFLVINALLVLFSIVLQKYNLTQFTAVSGFTTLLIFNMTVCLALYLLYQMETNKTKEN